MNFTPLLFLLLVASVLNVIVVVLNIVSDEVSDTYLDDKIIVKSNFVLLSQYLEKEGFYLIDERMRNLAT